MFPDIEKIFNDLNQNDKIKMVEYPSEWIIYYDGEAIKEKTVIHVNEVRGSEEEARDLIREKLMNIDARVTMRKKLKNLR